MGRAGGVSAFGSAVWVGVSSVVVSVGSVPLVLLFSSAC